MPPRASTSQLSRSPPPVTAFQDDEDLDMNMMEPRGGASSVYDDDEHGDDEPYDDGDDDGSSNHHAARTTRGNGSKNRGKGRSTASGSASNAGSTTTSTSNQTRGATTTDAATATMSKEEAALADRRRRNRETQRAIRKKKAARLQDAEVKASIVENELEKLRLKLRESELENTALKREIEDWRAGRLHASVSTILPSRLEEARPSTYSQYHPGSEHAAPASTAYNSSSSHYHSYELPMEERKVLGKRKSFDVHTNSHSTTDNAPARGPPFSRISISPPSVISRASPSVLQPVPISLSYARKLNASPDSLDPNPQPRPATLDTHSHEDGFYGDSDPSPSSAGTVRPSYSSAFDETPVLSEAISITRLEEAAAAATTTTRSNSLISLQSTTASIPTKSNSLISEASSPRLGGLRSYDDYHDFWTTASHQSQSDSLTSMSTSSYSRNASSSFPPPSGAWPMSGVPAGIVNAKVDPAVADGMILSMSRQSLCASPLSMAHSPKEEENIDELMEQQQSPPAPADERETYTKPSLPSLSSSLGRAHLMPHTEQQRTASLPPPMTLPPLTGSPPHRATNYYQQHQQHQHHQIYPSTHTSVLPPIPSVLLGRRNEAGHSSSSFNTAANGGILPPMHSKPYLTTRNGRGKSTSYPLLSTSATIFENPPPLGDSAMRQQEEAMSSSYARPALPLPQRASSRAPISSTRDDITTPPPSDEVLAKIGGSGTSSVVTSPSQYDDESTLVQDSISGSRETQQQQRQQQHASDRRTTQRRKSTYEDFMEVFGSNGTA